MLASDHGFTWGEGRPTELSSVANATAAQLAPRERHLPVCGATAFARRTGHARTAASSRCARRCSSLAGLPPGATSRAPRCRARPRAAAERAVDYRRLLRQARGADGHRGADSSRVDADTVAKLKALGYIGGGEEATGRALGTRTAGSLNNEGLLLKQQNKIDEAIDAFDRALTVDPNLASALWNLSDLLFAQNRSLDKSDDAARPRVCARPAGRTEVPDRPRHRLSAQRAGRSQPAAAQQRRSPPSRTTRRCCSSAAAIASRPATAPRG